MNRTKLQHDLVDLYLELSIAESEMESAESEIEKIEVEIDNLRNLINEKERELS